MLKLQLILGLFLLSIHSLGNGIDSMLWGKIKQININSFQLIDQNIQSAESISDSLFSIIDQPYDSIILSDLYSVKASINFAKTNYEGSVEFNLKALIIRRNLENWPKVINSLANLGNAYYYLNSYANAISNLLEADRINQLQSNNLNSSLIGCYNTLGLVYQAIGKIDSAFFWFDLGLNQLSKFENLSHLEAELSSNLGGLYIFIDSVKKAIPLLKYSISINNQLGINNSWNYMRLGSGYLKLNMSRQAIENLKKADLIIRSSNGSSEFLELKKDIFFYKSIYFLQVADTDSAKKYFLQYNLLQDSIITQKTKENIQKMEAKYQVEKNKAALTLSKEREALAKSENKTNKLYLTIALIGLIVLGLVSFYTIRNSRQKRQISEMKLDIKDIEMKSLMANQESESFAAMLKGQEEERERIAQDLHDRLGGTLAALKHSLRRTENKVDPEDLKIIDEAVIEVRNIAHNLSSGLLEKQGLNVALEQLKATIERSGKLIFNLYLHSSMAELGQEVALELYRIVQELTNNTLKHANASEISLQTSVNDRTFNLIYEDNGIGFDQSQVNGGIGLHNLKARVKKINGTLHIDSGEGRGTITIIELDLKT